MKQKDLVIGALTALTILVLAVAMVFLYIGSQAQAVSAKATNEFPGDNVEALLAYLDSDTHSLDEKNKAVWALGRLKDKRALPDLEKL
jgi:HEAT repeat protein